MFIRPEAFQNKPTKTETEFNTINFEALAERSNGKYTAKEIEDMYNKSLNRDKNNITEIEEIKSVEKI